MSVSSRYRSLQPEYSIHYTLVAEEVRTTPEEGACASLHTVQVRCGQEGVWRGSGGGLEGV
eukprot:1192873-Prorocentrum_minimum.AAC.7